MSSSIRETWNKRQSLLNEADQLLRQLAIELMKLIPHSMKNLATEKGWILSDNDHLVDLPEFLQFLANNTVVGDCHCFKVYEDDLERYDFSSFEELEVGLNDLSSAWSGVVRISWDKKEDNRWEVFFCAEEFIELQACVGGSVST